MGPDSIAGRIDLVVRSQSVCICMLCQTVAGMQMGWLVQAAYRTEHLANAIQLSHLLG